MFFPKLEHLCNYNGVTKFVVKELDEWLASQPEMYYNYLNPLSFVSEVKINKKLGLTVFSLASREEFFKEFGEKPLLKIKYIVNCPSCDTHYATYHRNSDIPITFVNCIDDECQDFNPSFHPEKIEIYYELLERPIIEVDDLLDVYSKPSVPPLLAGDEDFKRAIWEIEERNFR
jgi:hypothetical protein